MGAVQGGGAAAAAAARGAAQDPETWAYHVPQTETFRWARCKEAAPLPQLQRVGLPLPVALLDVLEPALAWEDLQVRTAQKNAKLATHVSAHAMQLRCAADLKVHFSQHLVMHVGALRSSSHSQRGLKTSSFIF